jgi:hypothetical protein
VVPVWKKLLPIPFFILALVAVYFGVRANAASPVASSAPSSEPPPDPSAASADAGEGLLTKKEREEISVPISPEKCAELQQRVAAMPDPPPGDPRALRFMAACMRHGNVAWLRCASVAQTRADMNACSRRLLHNELAP